MDLSFLNAIDYVTLAEIGIAFGLKMADNALGTVKTLYLSKGKFFGASLFASMSTLFYLLAIVRIANSNDMASIIAMCAATFLGTLMPCYLLKKSERDKLYIFDVTSDSMDSGKEFADTVRNSNIAVNTSVVYDKNMKKTLMCKIYCATKEQSRMINDLLKNKNEFKYNVYVPIEE